ncbi:prepilin-type N-terminal cleavage/methylation domain-containing protein [Campylobacter sp. LR196d]|uniref:prepilin-type N-terminal cleavage/methylation domain-containing protein n=1 Tax=Campylobacter sp. LR196d TaxID=2593543 RepID=UPI0012383E85|nr:prepilin-type N-terminal cleavage/methylation domain-containing protein [Campylobacter sp. LR196d]KAA6225980.1 prepilin-type N-terminal cleavage/methylation domain-containing protein [Campylobacter sp. LR196d]
MNSKAFSLLELVIVIIIIGILVSFAFPLLNKNKEDASILKAKIDYELLNSALALMRHEANLKNLNYNGILDSATTNLEGEKLFYCDSNEISNCNNGLNCCSFSLLQNPIYSSKKAWIKLNSTQYRYFINQKSYIDFSYNANTGLLECLNSILCKEFL